MSLQKQILKGEAEINAYSSRCIYECEGMHFLVWSSIVESSFLAVTGPNVQMSVKCTGKIRGTAAEFFVAVKGQQRQRWCHIP